MNIIQGKEIKIHFIEKLSILRIYIVNFLKLDAKS